MAEDDGGTNERGVRLPPNLLVESEQKSRLTLADALQLGSNLEHIRGISDKSEPSRNKVVTVLEATSELLRSNNLDTVVISQVQEAKSKYQSLDKKSLNDREKATLAQEAITWTHLLNQEFKREKRIPVSDTGLLDVDLLVDSPENLFTPAVWDWLDERPRLDLQEACKTIVVGCSTSSVMLSLRAVEHCLSKWYEKNNESLDAAWGRVLDQLMEEYAEDDKKNDTVLTQLSDLPPVLSNLYYLKEKRNEVNHPDESPSPQEARRTLMIVAATITEIFEEMRGIAAKEANKIEISEESGIPLREVKLNSETEERVLEAMEEMSDNTEDSIIRHSAIVDLIMSLGYGHEKAEGIIQTLLMSGRIYEPEEGKYKII